MRAKEKSRGKEGDQNSDTRYKNIKNLTNVDQFGQTLDSLKEVLTYHHEKGGICQHGDPSFKGKNSYYPMFTQRAFINIIEKRKLLLVNGSPCSKKFMEFELNEENSKIARQSRE
jgi:hypothetical protein